MGSGNEVTDGGTNIAPAKGKGTDLTILWRSVFDVLESATLPVRVSD